MQTTDSTRFRLPHWGWIFATSIVLFVGGIGLSIWMPIYREKQAVEKIESLGGRVVGMETGGPEWLRPLIGEERMNAFIYVHSVDLSRSAITDNDLPRLSALSRLQILYLNGTAVTDDGLARWSAMRTLRALYLYDTAVTDKAIAELKKANPRCDVRH